MKYLILMLMTLAFTITMSAQEPGNNLRKSISELRQKFPDLMETESSGGIIKYKSPKAEAYFHVKNDMVIE